MLPSHRVHPRLERSTRLRRKRQRRIFRYSLAIAVVAHALVLWFSPWFRNDPRLSPGTELAQGAEPPFGGIAVNVIFGPPAIVDGNGALAQEPDWRVLSASRVLPPPPGCASHDWFEPAFAKGEVRLILGETGRPDTVSLAVTTGDRCWNGVMVGLAGDLRYLWLPNDEHVAPVELVQPVTLSLRAIEVGPSRAQARRVRATYMRLRTLPHRRPSTAAPT